LPAALSPASGESGALAAATAAAAEGGGLPTAAALLAAFCTTPALLLLAPMVPDAVDGPLRGALQQAGQSPTQEQIESLVDGV
jgi:hypothetical protein